MSEPRHLGPVVVSGLARGVVAGVFPGAFLALAASITNPYAREPVWAMALVLFVGFGAALGVGDALACERPPWAILWRAAAAGVAPLAGGIPSTAVALASQGRTLLDWKPTDPDDEIRSIVVIAFVCFGCGVLGGLALQLLATIRARTPALTRLERVGAVAGITLLLTSPAWTAHIWAGHTSEGLLLVGLVVLAGGLLWLGLELGERAARVVEERLG